MRKIDASVDPNVLAAAYSPGGAGKIAESVNGDDDGFVKRRHMEGRREVCEVMLDVMYFNTKPLTRKVRREQTINALTCPPILEAVDGQPEARALVDQIAKLPEQMCTTVLID